MLRRASKVGRKYSNPVPTAIGGLGTIFKLLPHYLTNKAETAPAKALGPFRTDVSIYATAPESGLRVTWMGHSSLLVEIDGVRLLMDPVWDERASPMRWAGPKRFFAPTMRLEELPSVDVVLVSHDHYDHLGEATIRGLVGLESMRRAKWVTSLGVGKVLQQFGVEAARITVRRGQVFFAELDTMGPRGRRVLPCRPSDAIALALRQRLPTPILVGEWVFTGADAPSETATAPDTEASSTPT